MNELASDVTPVDEVAPPLPAAAPIGPMGINGKAISGFRQWYMVIALTVLSMVATLDRSSIQLLLDPMKADLKLTDSSIALLVGSSYTVFHIAVTFPMGWLIDRFNRKYLLIIGGLAWSACTVFSGTAHSFWQLFGGRAGVGFADGGVQPATFSLIRDGVSKERQGRAFGIYTAGIFVGGALALVVASTILKIAAAHGPMVLPVLGLVKPWQMVFLTVALGGLPFIGLMFWMIEPARTAAGMADRGTYLTAIRYMIANWRIYLPLMGYNTIFGMTAGSYGFWSPTLVHRTYGVPLPQVGPMMGLIVLIAPALGLFSFGSVVDALTRRGLRNGPAMVIVAGVILTAIPAIASPLMPNVTAFWISYACLMLVAASMAPATQVINTRITPSQSAGKIAVIYFLPQSLIGLAGGVVIVGLFSDKLFSGPLALAHAMSLTSAIFLPIALLLALWLVRQTKNLVRLEERNASVA